MSVSPNGDSLVSLLERQLGSDWTAIRKARASTLVRREELQSLFQDLTSSDSGLVVFGSVARGELTSSSDLDWILLIDSQAFPEHKEEERDIERRLAEKKFILPGSSGIFGRMVGSHGLVHNIGGEDDLNSNTTRRVLLLLESLPIGNREAYDRVRRQILRRYLIDDRGLTYGSGTVRIPRFLLNDLTRYWRTITVDFVYKQTADNDEKWALRNAKLRLSRKLIFAAGLLTCFFCHLDADAGKARQSLREARDVAPLTDYLEHLLWLTPLDKVAKACLEGNVRPATARKIFDHYDRFLAILDDSAKREELAGVRGHEGLRKSTVWKEIQQMSHPFHEGLVSLFLNEDQALKELTMEYGIF